MARRMQWCVLGRCSCARRGSSCLCRLCAACRLRWARQIPDSRLLQQLWGTLLYVELCTLKAVELLISITSRLRTGHAHGIARALENSQLITASRAKQCYHVETA